MAALLVDLAEAVRAHVAAMALPEPVAVVRAWYAEFDLRNPPPIARVTVIPAEDAAEMLTRTTDQDELRVDIVTQKKLNGSGPIENSQVDALVAVCDAIAADLHGQRRRFDVGTPPAAAHCVRTERPIPADETWLSQSRLFVGVQSFVFRRLP